MHDIHFICGHLCIGESSPTSGEECLEVVVSFGGTGLPVMFQKWEYNYIKHSSLFKEINGLP